MIFDLWLDMPIWGIFGALVVLLAPPIFLLHWLCFSGANRERSLRFTGVVAPFFSSVAILFSLLTGFLANDVWDRNRQASRAVLAERDGLAALQTVSMATSMDMRDIRIAALRYGEALIEDEWPRMRDQEESERAGQALLDLLAKLADPRIGAEAGPAAQHALLDAALRLRSARYDRLAVSGDRTDRTKWAAVLILALITQVAIAAVHLDKPNAQALALSIFTAAAVTALGLVAIRERPFDGPLRLSPAALEEALRTMRPAGPP